MVEQTALIRSVEPRGRGSREEIRALEPCKQLFRAGTLHILAKGREEQLLILCVVLYTAATVIPRVNTLFNDIQASVSNIQKISKDLSDANLPEMIDNMDRLVTTSESSIETAVEKLNSIDFDSLNSAIRDLANIVRPLGKLFGG